MSNAPKCPLCGRSMDAFSRTGEPEHLVGYACPVHGEETCFVRVEASKGGSAA